MESELSTSIETWVRSLPSSRMIFPSSFLDRTKYVFWRLYTPYHPSIRDACVSLGLVHHEGRQNYLLGTIAPGQSVAQFVSYLVEKGFRNHFVAWKDDGEIVSLRIVKDFRYQYHVRVFEDGEVRAHYEFTPEYRPILHIKEIGVEPKRAEFLQMLGDRITVIEE